MSQSARTAAPSTSWWTDGRAPDVVSVPRSAPRSRVSVTASARILVVGPAWVGDMVMAQSLFQVLARRDPTPVIDVLAPGWTRPLLERMPQVTDALEMPLGHGQLGLGERRRIGRRLQSRGYSQAVVLPASLKSALVPFWARIPQRTGFRGEARWGLLNDIRALRRGDPRTTVQRFVALAVASGDPAPDPPPPALRVDTVGRAATLIRLGVGLPDRPVLGLCPGAEFGPSKRWPQADFVEVALRQRELGWRVWVFGSAKDAHLGAYIARHVGEGCADFTGKTSLADALDLLSLTTAVVSNDSGLMHVAAALGRPLVAVYGATDPAVNPPLHPHARVLWRGLDCSPCMQRECPLGHYRCLSEIRPPQVWEALDELQRPR